MEVEVESTETISIFQVLPKKIGKNLEIESFEEITLRKQGKFLEEQSFELISLNKQGKVQNFEVDFCKPISLTRKVFAEPGMCIILLFYFIELEEQYLVEILKELSFRYIGRTLQAKVLINFLGAMYNCCCINFHYRSCILLDNGKINTDAHINLLNFIKKLQKECKTNEDIDNFLFQEYNKPEMNVMR